MPWAAALLLELREPGLETVAVLAASAAARAVDRMSEHQGHDNSAGAQIDNLAPDTCEIILSLANVQRRPPIGAQ